MISVELFDTQDTGRARPDQKLCLMGELLNTFGMVLNLF